jgi:predicted membrane-bound spermidine synthase
MIFEIVGSRVLGPYFGTSVFVWTSLIGIVMGSLSVGYWLGGRVSQKRNDLILLAWILFLAGFLMLGSSLGHDYVLRRIVKYIYDFRLRTVLAVIVLFGPASICLAMILPYVAKMQMDNVRTAGSAIGNLYALSTLGSIVGTFAAGFVLVPVFGFAHVLFATSVALLIIAIAIFVLAKKTLPVIISFALSSFLVLFWFILSKKPVDYVDVDTQYNRVIIYNSTDNMTGRPVKILKVNDEKSSAMFTDVDDDLVFEVLKYYRLAEHFHPGFRTSLMIGGSGYAFPKDYLKRYPLAAIDVVEIDPGLTRLAKQYFNLTNDSRLLIYHEDGRTYLNRCEKKYDAVFMDAYKSMLTIPYQLSTQEAVQKISGLLNEQGAVYANIISSLDPKNDFFLRSEIATYKSVFPQVYLFAVQYPDPSETERQYFQNFLLVGLKSSVKPNFVNENEELQKFLNHLISIEPGVDAKVLTDEFAPVEFYASRALSRITRQN